MFGKVYAMLFDSNSIFSRWRLQTALILAIGADAVQLLVLPLFSEGALSPFDDVLDLVVAGVLVRLLGWHWEFLPAFAAELVPGLDLVPFWTLAVANVYRKSKQFVSDEDTHDDHRVIEGEYKSS
ncbi:MAG TPA: hypothetical protein VLW06_15615 [Terriglobales bacterium]|nr:hypothetical protein [Terriglobales bacterium]